MFKYMKHLTLLFMILIMGTAFGQQFQVPVTVSDGANSIDLFIGVDPAGTDGFDTGLDQKAPPPPPAGAFDARLKISSDDLVKDVRGNSLTLKTYIMTYLPATGQGPIVLSWDPVQLAALGTFEIVDNVTGTLFGPFDMTSNSTLAAGSNPLLTSGIRILVTPSQPADLNAEFVADVTNGAAPLTVNFTDQSSPGAAPITNWQWFFGDGAVSSQQNPSHTYNIDGSFDVRLIVTNANAEKDTVDKLGYINILAAPQAQFAATPLTGATPLTVTFTDQSVPGSGPITSRLWNFGDGSTSTAQNPVHAYNNPGLYTVSLQVQDVNNLSDTETKPNYLTVVSGTASLFEIDLTVSDGLNSGALTLGYNVDATDAYDFGLDVKAPPAPPVGAFDARLAGVSGSPDGLLTDLRNPTAAATKSFNVNYQAATGQNQITISWSPLSSALDDYNVTLVDGGNQIDMKNQTSAVVTSANQVTIQIAPGKNVFAFIEVTEYADVLLTNQCTFVCTVYVDMRQSPWPNNYLGSFTGSIYYSQHVVVVENSPILSGFQGNILVNAQNRRIDFDGALAAGRSGLVPLFTLELAISDNVGSQFTLDLDFSAVAAAYTFESLLPKLNIDDLLVTIKAPNLLGDVNGDAVDPVTGQILINPKTGRPYVNSTDALIILSYDVNMSIPTPFLRRIQAGVGDVNCDGLTNSTDALIILSYDVGLPVFSPLGQPTCGCE